MALVAVAVAYTVSHPTVALAAATVIAAAAVVPVATFVAVVVVLRLVAALERHERSRPVGRARALATAVADRLA